MLSITSTPNNVQRARCTNLGLALEDTHRAGVSVWSLTLKAGYRFEIELDDAAEPHTEELVRRLAAEAFLAGEKEKAAEIRRVIKA